MPLLVNSVGRNFWKQPLCNCMWTPVAGLPSSVRPGCCLSVAWQRQNLTR